MKIVLLVLSAMLALASFIPLIRKDPWWIRMFDFPRGQVFITGVACLAAFFAFASIESWWDGLILAALAVGLIVQAGRIFPYTPFYPKEVLQATDVRPDATLSILVANVLMDNRSSDRLLAIIRDRNPDVILTLEPDQWWTDQLSVLDAEYPHAVKEPLDNRYGMVLQSRYELLEPEVKHLVSEEIPSMHAQLRLPSGDLVRLHCVHPEPPSPTEAETSTERDAELLIVGKEVKEHDDAPTIVFGDLNDVAWSYTTTLFQKISSLLDPRKGRGMYNSFHAKYFLFRWPLDHIFHSNHFMLEAIERLPAFGSDHFPVYIRLVLQPGAEALQEEPEADAEEREEAEEKIEQVDQKDAL